MQKLRGFIYFKDKSYTDIVDSFKDFKFDFAHFGYFKELNRYDNQISAPGIFITGEIKNGNNSSDVIKKLRNQIGLNDKIESCDLAIEDDKDILKELKPSELKGNYIGIRILAPYNFDRICSIAKELGTITNSNGIYVRTCEENKVCIELITEEETSNFTEVIAEKIHSNNLIMGEYTFLRLE